jgi:hypothetical protein
VVHGTHAVVDGICDHPDIRAVSFVGSDAAGKHVYARASAAGKRVQCNMGAKNHAVVMPDAAPEATANALVGAAFGAAGRAVTFHILLQSKPKLMTANIVHVTNLTPESANPRRGAALHGDLRRGARRRRRRRKAERHPRRHRGKGAGSRGRPRYGCAS